MPNNWNAIYLGQFSVIDPTEGNTVAENAALLAGQTYGALGTPLSERITFISTNDRGGTAAVLDQNNNLSNDRITFNIGAGNQTTNFDAAVQYNATLTYDHGGTYAGTFVIIQDSAGRTFLVPPPAVGTEITALQANPIRSITLNSGVSNSFQGLGQNRPTTTVLTGFVAGTLIRTATGDRAVETLTPGDLVVTADDGLQPLRWTGRLDVEGTGRFAPIRFRAGALGNTRDLRVSPQHRMLVTGWQAELLFGEPEVLVPACHLVNDHTIRPERVPRVAYHHILFDRHQIITAEGCPTESFFPGGATLAGVDVATRGELLALLSDLARDPACDLRVGKRGYGATARMVICREEAMALRQSLTRHH